MEKQRWSGGWPEPGARPKSTQAFTVLNTNLDVEICRGYCIHLSRGIALLVAVTLPYQICLRASSVPWYMGELLLRKGFTLLYELGFAPTVVYEDLLKRIRGVELPRPQPP
jgi:hypothetical protein